MSGGWYEPLDSRIIAAVIHLPTQDEAQWDNISAEWNETLTLHGYDMKRWTVVVGNILYDPMAEEGATLWAAARSVEQSGMT